MKPVAIIRYAPTEGPGYFATFLDTHRIGWQLVRSDAGDAVPPDSEAFSGVALMGGPMSVNDDLPSIIDSCRLIRDAVARGVPVIGHCLGGQLISKALGGQVHRNPVAEIGWLPVQIEDKPLSEFWLGKRDGVATVFQWHGEAFSIPPGATRILRGTDCANQAFVLGPHLAMQFHVEMTDDLIRSWCADWHNSHDPAGRRQDSIQSPQEILAGRDRYLPGLPALANRLYSQWIDGLRR